MLAAAQGETYAPVITKLLSAGADPNAVSVNNSSPLMLAIASLAPTVGLIRLLCRKRAGVEHLRQFNKEHKEWRTSPLLMAAIRGLIEAVEILLGFGARPYPLTHLGKWKNVEFRMGVPVGKRQRGSEVLRRAKGSG